MARKPKVIEVPGDVAPVEVAAPAPAPAEEKPVIDGDYYELNGVKHLILERSVSGWILVHGLGYMRVGG